MSVVPARDEALSPGAVSAPPSGMRELWPYYAALILASYAVTLLTDGAYWYATKVIQATAAESLWLSAFWGLCYIPISLLAGRWADRHGARRMARLMLGLGMLTALLVWGVELRPSVVLLGALLILYNLTTSTVWPAIETAVTKMPGAMSLNNRLTLYNMGWASTNCLALATVGVWAKLHVPFLPDWSMIFVVPAVVSGAGLLVLVYAKKPSKGGHAAEDTHANASGNDAARAITTLDPKTLLHMARVGNVMCYVATYVLLPLLPALTESAGFPDKTVATAVAATWAVTRLMGFVGTWAWSKWHYKPGLLIAVQVLMTLSFLATVAVPIIAMPWGWKAGLFISAQGVFGFCAAFMYASSLYYAMHVSSGAGAHAGIHEALIGLGVAIGPTFGALFGWGTGATAMWGVATAVTAVLVCGVAAMVALATWGKRRTL